MSSNFGRSLRRVIHNLRQENCTRGRAGLASLAQVQLRPSKDTMLFRVFHLRITGATTLKEFSTGVENALQNYAITT